MEIEAEPLIDSCWVFGNGTGALFQNSGLGKVVGTSIYGNDRAGMVSMSNAKPTVTGCNLWGDSVCALHSVAFPILLAPSASGGS